MDFGRIGEAFGPFFCGGISCPDYVLLALFVLQLLVTLRKGFPV